MAEKEPQLDQDGKMINPHNPEFITKVPWYLGNSGPTLKHHNIQKADHFLSISESDALIQKKLEAQKDAQKNSVRTVYRKGACKNCGAMTHNEKNCVERPRSNKKAAWKTGVDIAPDEVSLKLEEHGKVSYDAKRDQWKGYNPQQYKAIIEKHERLELERAVARKEKEEELRKQAREDKKKKKEELDLLKQQKLEAKKQKKLQMKNAASAASFASSSSSSSAAATTGAKRDADFDDDVHDKTTDSDHSSDSDSDSDAGSDYDSDSDAADEKEFLANDEQAGDFQGGFVPQGGLGGAGMRQTVRNLRIREDMPKYLRNLDLNSAFYDPKSRAMRSNPLPDENPEDLAFAGDNFIRYSGDAVKLAQNQLLCWEMQERGESIDVLSNPSQAELIQRQFVEKKKQLETVKRSAILDKYTDGKANPTLDPRLKLGQTEAFLEYTRDGRLMKGSILAPAVRTKYEEDVCMNNHTSVWGSYYCRAMATWGYACCHSLLKSAYCTGAKGRAANDAASRQQLDSYQARKMLQAKPLADRKSDASALTNRSGVFGESSASASLAYDPEKIKQAQQKAEQLSVSAENAAAADGDKQQEDGAQKRSYNSMQSVEVTEEDMEVYRMKRSKKDDPMAHFMGDAAEDQLLEYNP